MAHSVSPPKAFWLLPSCLTLGCTSFLHSTLHLLVTASFCLSDLLSLKMQGFPETRENQQQDEGTSEHSVAKAQMIRQRWQLIRYKEKHRGMLRTTHLIENPHEGTLLVLEECT